jgi:hypothetical protein
MRFQFIFTATLQATQLLYARASPIADEVDAVSVKAREADPSVVNNYGVDSIAKRSNEDIEIDLDSGLAGRDSDYSMITKRKILGKLQLMADTGNRYRVPLANGVVIFLHIFYDLGIQKCTYFWELDQAGTIPSSVSFGLKDTNNGNEIPISSWAAGRSFHWAQAKLYDFIQVLV